MEPYLYIVGVAGFLVGLSWGVEWLIDHWLLKGLSDGREGR